MSNCLETNYRKHVSVFLSTVYAGNDKQIPNMCIDEVSFHTQKKASKSITSVVYSTVK